MKETPSPCHFLRRVLPVRRRLRRCSHSRRVIISRFSQPSSQGSCVSQFPCAAQLKHFAHLTQTSAPPRTSVESPLGALIGPGITITPCAHLHKCSTTTPSKAGKVARRFPPFLHKDSVRRKLRLKHARVHESMVAQILRLSSEILQSINTNRIVVGESTC